MERIRSEFPILGRQVHGHRLVYLDSAATSQKPRSVIDAVSRYYEDINSNVHRGVHYLADQATEAYENARARVARFIGADDPRGIVYTRNTTEAINLFARTWGVATLKPGDEIVTTEIEHHSNLVPWQMLAALTGATLRVAPVRPDATLDLDALRGLISPRTRLVAMSHCSNVTGAIHPIEEIGRLAHAVGALLFVDAAQSAPHIPLDVKALDVDAIAFSSHKMLGPTGIGILWAKPEILEPLPPFMGGGSMIREVWTDHATWADIPARFEAGTPNIADAIAFVEALDYLDGIGMNAIREHETTLAGEALARLGEIPGLRIYGPPTGAPRSAVVSFNLFIDPADPDSLVHPHDVGTVLDAAGIAVRAGHHCCNPLMRKLDIPATVRASFYLYNDIDDLDTLVTALRNCREMFDR
ncbi:MAG: cysteine desulfurase [Chloroflexota bacterium]|nr:MAG: cysteine desulfurase [Chloroflexota bacterium]